MVFLSPLALFGLAAALVPPLLHLFQRREPPVVEFPAVRYLRETQRDARRTVRLQHLLLLLLRMLAVVLIVLAAARPVVPGGFGARHEPTALALVFDNSLSSGAVLGGTRVVDDLAARARETLREAQDGDAVWLIGADGLARRGTPAELLEAVSALAPEGRRMDLDVAVRLAARLVASSGYARGEIHVLSDLQRTAFDGAAAGADSAVATQGATDSALAGLAVLVYHPGAEPPPNVGVARALPQPSLWLPGSGAVEVGTVGTPARADARVTLTLSVDGRAGARALAAAGAGVELAAPALSPGWHGGEVSLEPDELRADDRRAFAVRVVAPATVTASPAVGPFALEALGVLAGAGRLQLGPGGDVRLGTTLEAGAASIVVPPADPAALGATNRQLAAAGMPWRFGARLERGDSLVAPDVPELTGGRVLARYRLEPTSTDTAGDVLAWAGPDAWLVRHGRVVVVASRLVPDETSLPLTGAFLPFVAALVNRVARGESGVLEAAPGAAVRLPARATVMALGDSATPVRGGAVVSAPATPGVYALRAGADTTAMLVVAPDPRESDLTRLGDAALAAHWRGARVAVTDAPAAYAARRFRGAGRSELTGPLLLAALLVLVLEGLLAAGGFARLTGRTSGSARSAVRAG